MFIEEIDNVKMNDLLETLVLFTKLYHKPFSAEALTAGLPIEPGAEAPELFSINKSKGLFSRAASRAGLKSSLFHRPLRQISPLQLPVILLLSNQSACILDSFNEDKTKAKIILPSEDPVPQWVDIDVLEDEYIGYGFMIKKDFDHETETGKNLHLEHKHWFWNTLKLSAGIYKDALLASLLVNLFILASPLFTMNVYDRVVPNNAIETLWMFALGVFIVYMIDIFAKFTRTYLLEIAAKKSDIIMSSIIFEKILALKLSHHPASVGSFANSIKDFDNIRNFLTNATIAALIDLPFSIIFLATIAYIGGSIVIFPILTMLVILGYTFYVKKPLKESIEAKAYIIKTENYKLIKIINKYDVIVDCSDNFSTRFELNRACVAHRTPLVSGGVIQFEGQVSVFDSRDATSPCYQCLYKPVAEGEGETCARIGVLAPAPGIIGSIQACEVLKLLLGLPTLTGKLLLMDVLNMEWRVIGLPKDPACPVCNHCQTDCKMNAIPEDDVGFTNKTECIECFNCAEVCPEEISAITYRWRWKPYHSPVDYNRRQFLTTSAASLATVGLLSIGLHNKNEKDRAIRPPGALPEEQFQERCIRCMECVRICESNGGCLQPDHIRDTVLDLWLPVAVMRGGYCEYNCNLCGQVCPTEAILPLPLEKKQKLPIGLAHFDKNICIPYERNEDCIVCEEHCPLPDKAIKFNVEDVLLADGTSRKVKYPYVIKELCIGCGICEDKCPLIGKPGIFVNTENQRRLEKSDLT